MITVLPTTLDVGPSSHHLTVTESYCSVQHAQTGPPRDEKNGKDS